MVLAFSTQRNINDDSYLCGIAEPTLKNYKSGWKKFIYFLIKENYNNTK
jgi:hypothetical protein